MKRLPFSVFYSQLVDWYISYKLKSLTTGDGVDPLANGKDIQTGQMPE
jgi:hypothetical protein